MVNSNIILARATERRDAARQAEDVARREAESWDDFIRRFLDLGDDGAAPDLPTEHSADHVYVPSTSQQRPDVANSLRIARKFIEEANRPVPIAELLDEMDRHQVPLTVGNEVNVLDSRLRYYKREFKKILGRGWWLADRPLPQSNGSTAGAHHEQPAA